MLSWFWMMSSQLRMHFHWEKHLRLLAISSLWAVLTISPLHNMVLLELTHLNSATVSIEQNIRIYLYLAPIAYILPTCYDVCYLMEAGCVQASNAWRSVVEWSPPRTSSSECCQPTSCALSSLGSHSRKLSPYAPSIQHSPTPPQLHYSLLRQDSHNLLVRHLDYNIAICGFLMEHNLEWSIDFYAFLYS